MPNNDATILAELNALLRLTNTEIMIAETRRSQAGSDAIETELARNADKARERARLITAAIRDLGGLPNLVGVAAGRFGALAKSQLEQGQDLSEALLGDLALEQQLYSRARFLKVLAEANDSKKVVKVAERLERAHAETIEWLEIRLAEYAIGGPPSIRPTPVQAAVGAARRAAALPVRGATAGLNRSISALQGLRSSAEEVLDEQLDRAGDLKDAVGEIYTAGRNATLKRTERVAREEGAGDTAKAVRSARAATGALDSSELPIRNYPNLNVNEAVQRIGKLDDADDVRAILGYEQAHDARSRVIDAAQAQLGAIARDALGSSTRDGTASSRSANATRKSTARKSTARKTTARKTTARKSTPRKSTSGKSSSNNRSGSNGRTNSLDDLTVEELRDRAGEKDIEGRSSMNKDQLVSALRNS